MNDKIYLPFKIFIIISFNLRPSGNNKLSTELLSLKILFSSKFLNNSEVEFAICKVSSNNSFTILAIVVQVIFINPCWRIRNIINQYFHASH